MFFFVVLHRLINHIKLLLSFCELWKLKCLFLAANSTSRRHNMGGCWIFFGPNFLFLSKKVASHASRAKDKILVIN